MGREQGFRGLPFAGVVVPAHNEERGIARLLGQIVAAGDDLEIAVVCNGCTDRTVEVARAFEPTVVVLDLPKPSKAHALRAGDEVLTAFPRIYVDADVEITREHLLRLARSVREDGTLAAGPVRRFPWTETTFLVRSYYEIWQRLESVQSGLFGRGVIALSEAGHSRVLALPPVMSDDLAISEAFSDEEISIEPTAQVTIHPPRNIRDLIRRRIRVVVGNRQADSQGVRTAGSRTTLGELRAMSSADMRLIPSALVFLVITAVSRLRAQRAITKRDYSTWLRDESSRT